ncbi:hypothetical protein [Saliniramus sp.]|uniref:hypothetical protein n=1 Tax=Saliniramus sp. TaxID=2986772 RepID=UPI002C988377|nr:hypothetical protein [Saliniramus sp.]HMB11005.1 hypothetical protein [Saliniramus sp.]
MAQRADSAVEAEPVSEDRMPPDKVAMQSDDKVCRIWSHSALAKPAAHDIELWMLIHSDLRHTACIRAITAYLHRSAAITARLSDRWR